MTKKILLLGSGELGKEFVIAAQRKGQTRRLCVSQALLHHEERQNGRQCAAAQVCTEMPHHQDITIC